MNKSNDAWCIETKSNLSRTYYIVVCVCVYVFYDIIANGWRVYSFANNRKTLQRFVAVVEVIGLRRIF